MTKEEKILYFLVAKLVGHQVTIIREGVGELVGFSVGKGRSVAIDDLIAVVHDLEPVADEKPVAQMDGERIAAAIEACDWSGCPIGNKEILKAAVLKLREPTPSPQTNVEGSE